MMSMHTIRVTYDPTTRRISLVGKDNYGGATTDDNSVNIIVTGIVPDGENFKARIDFGVQVRTDDHIYNHPFVLLEQDNDEWSCIIPNPILRAAGQARCRLPIQLVIANDSYVINSRNTIMLEVTQAVDGEDDGSEIPPYDVPEWVIPEGQTVYYEDVHVVELTYDSSTREIEVANEKSKYGGSTIDCRSVAIQVTGITPIGNDFSVRADFAMPVKTAEGVFIRPFVVMEQIGNAWRCMVPQPVLMAAREQKKLPFQLVMRHGDTVINTRNAITLEITRAINAMDSIEESYGPYIMYRNDTWEWLEDFTYGEGAVVTYNGEMYTSLSDGNLGNQPDTHSDDWSLLTGLEGVSLGGIDGERVGSQVIFTSEQVFEAAGFAIENPPSLSGYEHIVHNDKILVDAAICDGNGVRIDTNYITNQNLAFVYDQPTAMAVWNITHNKNHKVQVQVIDTAGTIIMGRVTQPTLNTVTIEFNAPTTGQAIIE